MDTVLTVNDTINGLIWGPFAILLLMGTGLYLGIRLGFLQFTHIRFVVSRTLGRAFSKKWRAKSKDSEGDITSFQAAMTAVAAVVGSGNVAGVATAVVMGGPGALFWMWVAALIGMCTKFSEITLGIKFREIDKDGNVVGGPMYYLKNGLHQKWLGVIFAILTIPAGLVISAVVDTNTMTIALQEKIDLPSFVIGIIFVVLTGIVIIGGIKRIGEVCEIIAPFMGAAYILSGLVIIFTNFTEVPHAFGQIFEAAFNPEAGLGGVAGTSVWMVMRYGMARGIFSNEAGLGTGAIVHASAKVDHPCQQALWAPVELCIDTLLVCSVTGLTIVMSGLWTVGEELSGSALTMAAFDSLLPGKVGGFIVLGAVLLFGYSCLITWYYYVEKALEFLFGEKSKPVSKVLWLVFIIVGSVSSLGFVWDLADTTNGLMMIPNLIGLLFLSNKVVKLKKEYFAEQLPIDAALREEKRSGK
ncbi:MAG: sodium:alanine symporter family protein [Erysipelotrichaceae bacterium]|nr:sodium:alanine symporter family protein [Erysipelotrichaceae bacterium]